MSDILKILSFFFPFQPDNIKLSYCAQCISCFVKTDNVSFYHHLPISLTYIESIHLWCRNSIHPVKVAFTRLTNSLSEHCISTILTLSCEFKVNVHLKLHYSDALYKNYNDENVNEWQDKRRNFYNILSSWIKIDIC